MGKKFNGTFAFSKHTGELVNYDPSGSSPGYDYKSKEQARFVGELTYLSYSRGRSSALLEFTDGVDVTDVRSDGTVWQTRKRQFSFFMSKADEVIPLLVHGKLKGVFVPTKQGSNCAWMLDSTHCMNCQQPLAAHLDGQKCLFGSATFAVTEQR